MTNANYPVFGELPSAVSYLRDFNYVKLTKIVHHRGLNVLFVLGFSKEFTPQLLETKLRHSRMATRDAFSSTMKSSGAVGASALWSAYQGRFLSTAKSIVKMVMTTDDSPTESEWLETIRSSDEQAYQYGKFEAEMREKASLTYRHALDFLKHPQRGIVTYGTDVIDGAQIYFFKLS